MGSTVCCGLLRPPEPRKHPSIVNTVIAEAVVISSYVAERQQRSPPVRVFSTACTGYITLAKLPIRMSISFDAHTLGTIRSSKCAHPRLDREECCALQMWRQNII